MPMSRGRLRLRAGNKFWNCTDLNKKFLKTDQIKATVLTWQLNMNFKVCSFSQTVHIDLLTDGCNVYGLESHWIKIVFTHKVTICSVVGAQLTSKFFSLTTLFGLACLPSSRRRFSYILVLTGCTSLLMSHIKGWTSST